jgi:hypothetical protein
VRKSWGHDHSDQVKIWQLHRDMSVCQMNQLWEHCDSRSLGSMYRAELLAHLSVIPVVGMWPKKSMSVELM